MRQIMIVDLGSQYTSLIKKRIREFGVDSLIISPKQLSEHLSREKPKGIILSGGAASVYENASLLPHPEILELGIPILGICLGMHWIVQQLGGIVESDMGQKEYGPSDYNHFVTNDPLLAGIRQGTVWASHGDSVTKLPPKTERTGTSRHTTYATIRLEEKSVWGIQFHPEVEETADGRRLLFNFVFSICNAAQDWDWSPAREIERIQREVLEKVGPAEPVLLGFSGGSDSSILAAILAPVLRERLVCLTLNAGNLRAGEVEEIQRNAERIGCSTEILDAKALFRWQFKTLGDHPSAEDKRALFKRLYWSTISTAMEQRGIRYLVQGTLATDIIESGRAGNAETIKSHHNIGGGLHPFENLFKDEVRWLGVHLELPGDIIQRKPFPGPGLFVRWGDSQVSAIIDKESYLEHGVSQVVVALLGVNTTGVKGDGRWYGPSFCVRAIRTTDFMTCRGFELPSKVRREIRIALAKHPKVTGTFFCEDDKPPRTIEFE